MLPSEISLVSPIEILVGASHLTIVKSVGVLSGSILCQFLFQLKIILLSETKDKVIKILLLNCL